MTALAKQSLCSEQEIQAIRQKGQRCRDEYLSFTWIKAQENRHAISCSKRIVRRAVDRNYFKRINRVFATAPQTPPYNLHMLISARPALSQVDRGNIKQVVTNAWQLFRKKSSKL
ncbi:MAG: hypothetical protein CMF43_01780 [Legionellales bacterium]|jgi:ribonuclease P protein component|nr:hypothetical protein [Legionellales bacterium]|tara:strand:+ start:57 stop:401 length:345 start_codon:yes stop_codon:yes gene_type:complete